jgi:hypothetical protein
MICSQFTTERKAILKLILQMKEANAMSHKKRLSSCATPIESSQRSVEDIRFYNMYKYKYIRLKYFE